VLLNLIYTQSRGAWLAFGATALLVAGVKARRMIVPLVLIAGALYLWTPDFAVTRFSSSLEDGYDPALLMRKNVEEEEAASRVIQWRSFLPLMSEYGLIGVGFGQYGRVYKAEGYDTKARSAHATPIEIGVEQGIVALLVYFWLFAAVYWRASALLKDPDSSPTARVLALGLLGATVCVLLSDLSGARSRDGNVMAFYWVLAGLTLNIPLGADTRQTDTAPAAVTHTWRPRGQSSATARV
jgi:O-antigen ligase